MTLLHCKVGPAQVPVMGTMYDFALDKQGRAVCNVTITKHVKLLMAAGVYERLDDEPAAPTPAQLADPLTAIKAALLTAGSPKIIQRMIDEKPVFYAAEAWPETIAVSDEIANDLPPFAEIGKDAALTFTVPNGSAVYAFAGKVEETALYKLQRSDFVEPPPAPSEGSAGEQTPAQQNAPAGEQKPAEAKSPEIIDIKGIGPGLVKKLAAEGITTLEQVAELEPTVAAALAKKLKIGDAITRDKWVEQAKAFLKGPAPAAAG